MNRIILRGGKFFNFLISMIRIRKGINISERQQSYIVNDDNEKINCLNSFFGIKQLNRIDISVIKKYGHNIERLNRCLTSEAIRFKTNQEVIVFEIVYQDKLVSSNMSQIGSCGVDVYEYKNDNYYFVKTLSTSNELEMRIVQSVHFSKGEKEILIYLPSYAAIAVFNVILKRGSIIYRSNHKYSGTISIYGSSITQGCAASRSGLTYANLLGRLLNKKVFNYGYSESAFGQEDIVLYVAKNKSDIYILEYDHNATVTTLKKTHYRTYSIIRKFNPHSLIVLTSRFSGGLSISLDEENERISIISDTYKKAIAAGDKKVIFVSGKNALKNQQDCFADDRHPNDIGMLQIALLVSEKIEKFLKEL